ALIAGGFQNVFQLGQKMGGFVCLAAGEQAAGVGQVNCGCDLNGRGFVQLGQQVVTQAGGLGQAVLVIQGNHHGGAAQNAVGAVRCHGAVSLFYIPGGLPGTAQAAVAQGNNQPGIVCHEVMAGLFQGFLPLSGIVQGLFRPGVLQMVVGRHAQAQRVDVVVLAVPHQVVVVVPADKPGVVLEQLKVERQKAN